MLGKFNLVFVVAVIGGTILSVIEVDAHPAVNNSALCEEPTLDEAVLYLIRQELNNVEGLRTVNLIREDLRDVKNLLGSNRQQNNASSISRKDLEDLKAACTSNQQQNNESCISQKDFEDLRSACASNQQQPCPQPVSSFVIREGPVSALLGECRTRHTHNVFVMID